MKKVPSKASDKVCDSEIKKSKVELPILTSNTQLLRDIAIVFKITRKRFLKTSRIVEALIVDTTKPWCKYRDGKCITKKDIESILKNNNIFKSKISIKKDVGYFYSAAFFVDYLYSV